MVLFPLFALALDLPEDFFVDKVNDTLLRFTMLLICSCQDHEAGCYYAGSSLSTTALDQRHG